MHFILGRQVMKETKDSILGGKQLWLVILDCSQVVVIRGYSELS